MPKFIETLGQQVGTQSANNAVGAIFGLAMEKHNDKRQLRQQQKLQDMQIAGDMKLTDYNYQKQLEMWNNTNYGAQVAHMKAAGLNPGLLYGMSGGGGTTTGSGGGGGVSGGQAPSGGGEMIAQQGMGLQLGMMEAQKKLIEAQTKKTEVEAEKTAGVDTEEARTRIADLTQGIENKKAIESLTKAEEWLKQMEGIVQGATMEDRIDYINYAARRALTELKNAENETYINITTKNEKIKIIQQEAIAGILRNALTSAETQNVRKDTEKKGQEIIESQSRIQLNEQEIKNKANEITTSLLKLRQEGVKIDQVTVELELKKIGLILEANQPGIGKAVSRMITNLLDETKGIVGGN